MTKLKLKLKLFLNIIKNVVFFKTTTFWNFYKLFSSNFWSLFYFSTPFYHLIFPSFLHSLSYFPIFLLLLSLFHIFSYFFPSLYLILIFHFLYFINPSLSFYLLLLPKFSSFFSPFLLPQHIPFSFSQNFLVSPYFSLTSFFLFILLIITSFLLILSFSSSDSSLNSLSFFFYLPLILLSSLISLSFLPSHSLIY